MFSSVVYIVLKLLSGLEMDRIHSQVYRPKMLCQVYIKGWPRRLSAVCDAEIQVDWSKLSSNMLVLTILITIMFLVFVNLL